MLLSWELPHGAMVAVVVVLLRVDWSLPAIPWHTCLQMSQSYTRLPILARKSTGMAPACSMVRCEMQRRASSLQSATNASVGQAT